MNKLLALDQKIQEQITDIKLIYNGFHNTSYEAFWNNQKVQIRIPNTRLVNYENEAKILAKMPDTIYYQNGILIRKWFEGETLEKIKLDHLKLNNLLETINDFHKLNIELADADFFCYGKGTVKYQKLVMKYHNSPTVICHMDLNKKNILINKNNQIKLIDLEWARKCHKAFDVVSLYKEFNIDKEILITNFNLSKTEFNDFLYIANEFEKMAYAHTYKKLIKEHLVPNKQVTYFNNLVIKKKNKNNYNYAIKQTFFNKYIFAPKVIYEDDDYFVSKKISAQNINLKTPFWLKKIATTLRKFHAIKTDTNPFNLFKYIDDNFSEIIKNNNLLNANFTQLEISEILELCKNIKPDAFCHNDLSLANILVDEQENVKFIDFEYTGLNNHHFDLAYFASNSMLNENEEKYFLAVYKNYDWTTYIKCKVIANFYGLLWTLRYQDSFDIKVNIAYIKNGLKDLKKIKN